MPASEQGAVPGRYQVIPRTLIFILRGEDVLLLKGARDKRLWAGKYNGIGGHIERGEDALNAARRELLEETGLHIPALDLCGTILVDAGPEIGILIFIFRAQLHPGAAIQPVPTPEGALEWVRAAHIANLPAVADLPVLLPRVLAWQPGDAPFFAHSYYAGERLVVEFSAFSY